jgi:hypothetical protein
MALPILPISANEALRSSLSINRHFLAHFSARDGRAQNSKEQHVGGGIAAAGDLLPCRNKEPIRRSER